MTVRDTLRHAIRALHPSSPTPSLDAEVLLAFALGQGWSREQLAMQPATTLAAPARRRFAALLRRRMGGEPVAYLRGCTEFYGLRLTVNRHVLIPRPESEALVEAVLQEVKPHERVRIADIGTGSGCLAIAIATHRPQATVIATDRSARALMIAKANARPHHVRITFRPGDLLAPLKNFNPDLIVANLPYVTLTRYRANQPQLKFEPRQALVAGRDGLALYRSLLHQLCTLTQLPRLLILEMETNQVSILRHISRQLRLPYTWGVTRGNRVAIVSLRKP